MNLEEKIDFVENNLEKFVPGSLILPDTPEKFSLSRRMEDMKIPGVSIAIIDDYDVVWAKGYGLLKNGEEQEVQTNSLFQACSVSKMVTAAMVLNLVEDGTLDLDADVNRYLNSWKIPENDFTQQQKVTLRQLLSHHAGITRPDGGFEWKEGAIPTVYQVLNGEHPADVQRATVELLPGSTWQYSNHAFVILQVLLEDIFEKPYEQIVKEAIFEPLKMEDSTFEYPLSAAWAPREISLHDEDGKPTYPGMIPSAVGHAGLITTPTDLARFGISLMKAYQGRTDQVIAPTAVQKMCHQEMWVEDTSAFGFHFGQGLGVFMVNEHDQRILFHPGGNDPGASGFIGFIPEKGKGAAIMANGIQGLFLTLEMLSPIAKIFEWL